MPNPAQAIPNLASLSPADIIASAMRLVGALASGEVPSASELKDAGVILNQMLDAWSAERCSVFQVSPITKDANGATLSLVAGQQAYTCGAQLGGENFYLQRPPRIERASVLYSASQQTPVELPLGSSLTDVEWQSIANKTTPSILPQVWYDDDGFPDRTLYFWPVPTQANPIVLYCWQQLQQLADLQEAVSLPPGYSEAIRYNLAMRLAAEFPANLQKLPLVTGMAEKSKQRIQSLNRKAKIAWVDPALTPGKVMGNIYTGSPNRSHGF